MEKYLRMPISKSIIIVDGIITILGGITFGIEIMIYALIALLLLSIFSNKMMIGEGNAKILYIYSKKHKEIKEYLHNEMMNDSTDFEVIGGYKNKKGKIIMAAIDTKDYGIIKEAIKLIDPSAFIVVTNTYHSVNMNISIRK